jgi:hypothetical protein
MACGGCQPRDSDIEWTTVKVAHGVNGRLRQAFGIGRARPDDVLARLQICIPCDRRTDGNKCVECGCPVNVKAEDADEQCPLGKWEKVEVDAR